MADETDHDNPEWTRADFARADTADRLSPEWLAAFPRTGDGGARRSIGVLIAGQARGASVASLAA